jgi:hypothetical protein
MFASSNTKNFGYLSNAPRRLDKKVAAAPDELRSDAGVLTALKSDKK